MAKSQVTLLESRKYNNNQYRGQSLNFPLIGVTTFDDNSVIQVPSDQVDQFLDLTRESFDFVEVGSPQTATTTTSPISTKSNKVKVQPANKQEQEIWDLLNQADTVTLLEMAKEAQLDHVTTAAMSDGKLRIALFNKLKTVEE